MNWSKLTIVSLCGLLLCGINSAWADNGFYIGGSLGNASIEENVPKENIDVNSSDTGYKVFGGFKFTILAIEAGYVDFGGPTQNGSKVELNGFDAFGLVNMGIGPLDLFGKVGVFAWNSDTFVQDGKLSKDGTDPVYGVGAGLSLGPVSVRAEYEYFNMSDFENVTMLSLGVVYFF